MVEQGAIRVEQIDGLEELIQRQVRAALSEGAVLQDVEEIRRSPAGSLIRLEEQVKALRTEMEQRFTGVEQRFAALRTEMEQRFTGVEQRFAALRTEMDQRFDGMERRFTTLQWAVGLIYPFLLVILGKLFLR